MNSYPIFMIGYDFILKQLKNNNIPTDDAYRICERVYNDFLSSKFNDENQSEYDCISDFIDTIDLKGYIIQYIVGDFNE
jgi:hypothetical protein